MEENIFETIHPIIEQLGMNMEPYKTDDLRDVIMKIEDEDGECVGILYRGILFGDRKGEIIKHFLRKCPMYKPHTIFIDDIFE